LEWLEGEIEDDWTNYGINRCEEETI